MFAIKDFIPLIILGATVSAHMTLIDPIALGIHDPSVSNMNDPIISAAFGGPSVWSFPCKGFESYLDDPTKGAAVATWAAGSQQSFTLGSAAAATSGGAGGAPHNGGSCQISLSYDKGKTFTVIHSYIDNCPIESVASPTELTGVVPPFTFTVPADAPATGDDGTLFAWTWIAKITNMEVYSNCASVKITAGSGSTPAVAFKDRPSLFVADLNTGCINVPGTSVVYPNPGPDTTPAQVTANSASYQGTCGNNASFPIPAGTPNGGTTGGGVVSGPSSSGTGSGTSTSTASGSTGTGTGSSSGSLLGACGSLNGGALCSGTDGCCSSFNYCGSTSDYCGTGCQSAFSVAGMCTGGSRRAKALRA